MLSIICVVSRYVQTVFITISICLMMYFDNNNNNNNIQYLSSAL